MAVAAARGDAELVIHPQCFFSDGHFAGPDAARLEALREVMADERYDAIWFARGGYGSNRIAEAAAALPGGRFRLGPLTDTPFAGFYVFDMVLEREAGKEALTLPFAVNVAPDEGELKFLSHEEARNALALPRVLDGLPAAAAAADDADRSDLGPTLLLLTLLFVVGEAALARFVSVRRN